MKKTAKIVAVLLTLALVLTFSITALAATVNKNIADSADNASITMTWPTLENDAANDKPDRIRIVWRENNFFNERMPHTAANLKWFMPGGFLQMQDWSQTVDLPRIRIDLGNPVEESVRQTSWILLPQ